MQFYPLKIISDNTNIKFMKYWKINLIVSLILILFSLIVTFSLKPNFGIDFTGGVVIEARSKEIPDISKMREILLSLDLGDVSIQSFGNQNDFMIKIGGNKFTQDSVKSLVSSVDAAFSKNLSYEIEYRKTDFVGPQVGTYLVVSGIQALILSFFGIMLYIWYRFEWQFSLGVLLALIHDVIIALGFMCITRLDFNLSTIAAILTIIGYSVNDSVVIYDRIRENLRKLRKKNIDEIIDISINETLSRTILTVLTTLIANLSLILFGGEALKSFSILVFFGILIGTFSSICLSAPILKFFGLEKYK